MNLEQVKQFALAVGTRVESASGEWASVKCPLAPFLHDSGRDSHPSCAIKYGSNVESIFNCFTCESGNLLQMIQLLDGHGAGQPRYNLKAAMSMWVAEESQDVVLNFTEGDKSLYSIEKDIVWPEMVLSGFMLASKVPMAKEYLNARNVSTEMANALNIRWDLSRRAVCFPIRNWTGGLVGLRGRYVNPEVDGPRYHDYGNKGQRNKLPWYGESTVDMDKTIVMVESVFDYTAVRRVYSNILAPLSVGISEHKARRVRDALEVVTLFDNGQGGDKGRHKISKHLPGTQFTHLLPTGGADDPGEMTVNQLTKLLKPYIMLNTTE